MRWRVWYGDGVTREGQSLDDWRALPEQNAVIAKIFSDPPQLWAGYDTLVWTDAGIKGADTPCPEFAAAAADLAARRLLKYGRYLPDADYERLWRDAVAA